MTAEIFLNYLVLPLPFLWFTGAIFIGVLQTLLFSLKSHTLVLNPFLLLLSTAGPSAPDPVRLSSLQNIEDKVMRNEPFRHTEEDPGRALQGQEKNKTKQHSPDTLSLQSEEHKDNSQISKFTTSDVAFRSYLVSPGSHPF